jgi:CubicO group peptidase (beta-lactamase class C family)
MGRLRNNSRNSRFTPSTLPVFFLAILASLPAPLYFAQGSSKQKLDSIAPVVEEAIRAGKCPGAVVLIGHAGKVEYRRAFGYRSLVPKKALMTPDTIFDLASLTKVIATTTAVMQLVEEGKRQR